jgi:hypothetical protein
VPQFLVAAGFGRTKFYELLADGSLDSIVLGKRRLVLLSSYQRLIERQRAEGKTLPRPGTKTA